MTRLSRPFQLAAVLAAILLLSAGLSLTGCSKVAQTQASYRMGEAMRVGPFVYNVLESQWKTELGDMFQMRVPQNRFLLLRLTVTNSGGGEMVMPLLNLEDSQGNTFPELQDGQGITGWMGLLRSVPAAQTEEGWIAFDVPTNAYTLRLSDGGEADAEKTLLVDIPLSMDSLNDVVPAKAP